VTFQEINEQQDWENFAALQEQGIFLQSAPQKNLYESLGQKTWLFENGRPHQRSIRSLVTKIEAKRGTFLFLPYGPMVNGDLDEENLKEFFGELKDLAKKEGASFIRISPFWKETSENTAVLKSLGFRPAPLHMLAETLWLLDFSGKREEELMMGMEKKHRNLVRRAIKEGVEIKKTTDQEAIDRFWDLYAETSKRHNFTRYPKKLLQGQLQFFSNEDQALMLEAVYEGEVLASAMIMFYGNSGAYHHGASSSKPEHRKIPASYLLQWEAIKEAQKRGCKSYNFWGISPDKNKKHPFYGITHFKTGFGGRQFDLMPCHDLVVSPKYYLNWAVETVRKWRRGF